jgi:hypothetical protein
MNIPTAILKTMILSPLYEINDQQDSSSPALFRLSFLFNHPITSICFQQDNDYIKNSDLPPLLIILSHVNVEITKGVPNAQKQTIRPEAKDSGNVAKKNASKSTSLFCKKNYNFRLPDPGALGFGTFKCIALWYLSGFYMKKIIKYAFPNSEY